MTAGDPAPQLTVPIMHALAAAGADVIELGVPFSDPMADGPVIQRSSERALRAGVSLDKVLGYTAAFRATRRRHARRAHGLRESDRSDGRRALRRARRATRASTACSSSTIRPKSARSFAELVKVAGMDPIFLLAPTSTESRIEQVARSASGYIYYVSLTGSLARRTWMSPMSRRSSPRSARKTTLPLGVGFGIRDGETARAIGAVADAVVIGSRLIQEIERSPRERAAEVHARATDFMRARCGTPLNRAARRRRPAER